MMPFSGEKQSGSRFVDSVPILKWLEEQVAVAISFRTRHHNTQSQRPSHLHERRRVSGVIARTWIVEELGAQGAETNVAADLDDPITPGRFHAAHYQRTFSQHRQDGKGKGRRGFWILQSEILIDENPRRVVTRRGAL